MSALRSSWNRVGLLTLLSTSFWGGVSLKKWPNNHFESYHLVYSMGTEHRRPPHEYLPPNPKPYDYIVFRATEVKDLNVERHATDMQTAMLNNDPAIIGVSNFVAQTLPFVFHPQSFLFGTFPWFCASATLFAPLCVAWITFPFPHFLWCILP